MPNAKNLKPHQFKKGKSGNPKGRPKITINELQSQGLKKVEAYAAIQMMLKLSKSEIEKIAKSKTSPVWKVCVAGSILRDIQIRHITTVDSLFDRVFGRAKQTTEIGGTDGEPITSITIKYAK